MCSILERAVKCLPLAAFVCLEKNFCLVYFFLIHFCVFRGDRNFPGTSSRLETKITESSLLLSNFRFQTSDKLGKLGSPRGRTFWNLNGSFLLSTCKSRIVSFLIWDRLAIKMTTFCFFSLFTSVCVVYYNVFTYKFVSSYLSHFLT